jgi:hypothetical protein
MTICRNCSESNIVELFSADVIGNNVKYFECSKCRYVQTEDPYWLDQAYSSVINNSDTGIMMRNQNNVALVLATMRSLNQAKGAVIDCAGGYGILVRLLRDRGVEALWSDPYCQNLLAPGFERKNEMADLVTAFEAFEHFVDPISEIEKLFAIAPNLLISTEVIASPAPTPGQWWYYGLEHGQHIGFFRIQTLEFIAERFGKHLISDGKNYHLFTERPISASRWRFNVRIARRLPILFARGLSSKVWSDFEKMGGHK